MLQQKIQERQMLQQQKPNKSQTLKHEQNKNDKCYNKK